MTKNVFGAPHVQWTVNTFVFVTALGSTTQQAFSNLMTVLSGLFLEANSGEFGILC